MRDIFGFYALDPGGRNVERLDQTMTTRDQQG